MGFCKKTIGRIGCRGIYADRRKLQNFNLRNGRLEERTKTDAVQEKICTIGATAPIARMLHN
jgi:hypothetical protein